MALIMISNKLFIHSLTISLIEMMEARKSLSMVNLKKLVDGISFNSMKVRI